jgi:cell division protein FtsB
MPKLKFSTPRPRTVVLSVIILAAAFFVVQGGEYGTTDLISQHSRQIDLRRAIDSLRRDIDSLEAVKRQIENDPSVQERIAREAYGMVRGKGEILYRFTESDSAVSGSEGRARQP